MKSTQEKDNDKGFSNTGSILSFQEDMLEMKDMIEEVDLWVGDLSIPLIAGSCSIFNQSDEFLHVLGNN